MKASKLSSVEPSFFIGLSLLPDTPRQDLEEAPAFSISTVAGEATPALIG
jgi:hypothetical protein